MDNMRNISFTLWRETEPIQGRSSWSAPCIMGRSRIHRVYPAPKRPLHAPPTPHAVRLSPAAVPKKARPAAARSRVSCPPGCSPRALTRGRPGSAGQGRPAGSPGAAAAPRAGGRTTPSAPHRAPAPPAARTGPGSSGHPGSAGR